MEKYINIEGRMKQMVLPCSSIQQIEYYFESDFLRITADSGQFGFNKAKEFYFQLYKYLGSYKVDSILKITGCVNF